MDALGQSAATAAPGPAPFGRQWAVPVAWGVAGASAMLGLYLGLVTLAQGWSHAVGLFVEDRPFVLAIAAGFGVQLALWRRLHALQETTSAGTVAAGGGTGTAAMVACCAHHVADVLPLVGLAGAAAALDLYRTPLLWLGLALNLGGAVYLLNRLIRQERVGDRRDYRPDSQDTLKERN